MPRGSLPLSSGGKVQTAFLKDPELHREYPDIPYVKTMKPSRHQFEEHFIDRDWLDFRSFEKQFDYVSWLNQQ